VAQELPNGNIFMGRWGGRGYVGSLKREKNRTKKEVNKWKEADETDLCSVLVLRKYLSTEPSEESLRTVPEGHEVK
jgi:hypothetical protein